MAANDKEIFEGAKRALKNGLEAQRNPKGIFFFYKKDPIIDPFLDKVAKTKDIAELQQILMHSNDSRILEVAKDIPAIGRVSVALIYAD